MKAVLALVTGLLLFMSVSNTEAQVFVNGYVKSNGTYVAPHIRSNPDGIKSNNYGCMTPKR